MDPLITYFRKWFVNLRERRKNKNTTSAGTIPQKTTSADTLKKEFGVYPAASRLMQEGVDVWYRMYINHPPWESCDIRPLGLPSAIGRELARHALTEFSVTVSGGVRAEYLNQQIQTAANDFAKFLELGLCLGGAAMKPYQVGANLLVDISTTNFTPTKFDGTGKAIGGVFRTEPVRQENGYFVRLEYHDFQTVKDGMTIYTVRNKAFQSSEYGDIGREVALNSVPEWADLKPESYIEGLTGPLFAYFKPPEANNIEPESPLGASVYAGATAELIRQADEQWRLIRWEYESGKRRVYVDGVDAEQFHDEIFVVGAFSPNGDFFNVFSPDFRDDPLYSGFQRILQRIEFNVGLAYGTLSDPQSVEKTATEILAANQRQYVTEGAIQTRFQATLDDLFYAMDAICTLARLAPTGEYQAEYNWGDGVLDDPETRRQDMAMDATLVNQKLLNPWEFRMKWYGEDEETAKKMLPDTSDDVEPLMEARE